MNIPVCKMSKLWLRNAEEFVPVVPLITDLPPIIKHKSTQSVLHTTHDTDWKAM